MRFDREDLTFSTTVRIQFRVYLETAPEFEERYLELAREIQGKETEPFQALSFLFYHPGKDPDGLADVVVDYAPAGEWNRAGEKPAGDYSDHTYRVHYPGGG